jgi:hypothetical protein
MKISKLLTTSAAALALMAVPALAHGQAPTTPAGKPAGTPNSTSNPGTSQRPAGTPNSTSNPGTSQRPAGTPNGTDNSGSSQRPATPGPSASANAKGKAYGKYCQTESKEHVAGEHGTAFSKCVTAMAKLANGQANNPRIACKNESKQHVAGQHGTPFSACVSGAAKLLEDQAADDGSDTQTTGDDPGDTIGTQS